MVAPARSASASTAPTSADEPHGVSELDARRTVSAERRPEPEDHSSGLEEADFVVGLASLEPAKGLVEPARAMSLTPSAG